MTSVLVDERISNAIERRLMTMGFYPIKLPRHPALPEAIASHSDSLTFYSENRLFVPAEYCEVAPWVFTDLRERHPDIKITFTSDTLSSKYPLDCKMNFLRIGKKAFGRLASLSDNLKDFAKEEELELYGTAQGYPACATLAFGNSAITADRGLYSRLIEAGVSASLIECGDISLPPYEYGFIGGASGVFENKVYFLGDYKKHRSANIIESALKKEGFVPVSLSTESLVDLGGLIFIK